MRCIPVFAALVLSVVSSARALAADPATATATAPSTAPSDGLRKSNAWSHTWQYTRPGRGGKQETVTAHLWLPENIKTVRGIFMAGKLGIDGGLTKSVDVRAACAEKQMAVVYFEPHVDAIFDYTKGDGARYLETALRELAAVSRHPELEFAPMLTAGHSTAGIFCRNVAYWKPERVIGVVMIKSGNFQDHIPDTKRTLAGVPLLCINGEFEEFGPMGGDPGIGPGQRLKYAADPKEPKKRNQTQWVMVRMQLLDRRSKNPDNLMGLVVHRGQGHGSWDHEMTRLVIQFIKSAADARIPKADPDGRSPVACTPLKAEDGWLADADIKNPQHKPAPFKEYTGDKTLALWYPDKATAEAVFNYHKLPWSLPDPTAGQPREERFVPPAILQDEVDKK